MSASNTLGNAAIFDVAIVGLGPAGEVLASTLGAAGLKVMVVERWPQPYALPRLTSLDGELCRVVQATGQNIDEAFATTSVLEAVHYVDAEGEPVASVLFSGMAGGWPSRVSMYQPDIERAIIDKIKAMPNVEIRQGWEAVELWQDAEWAYLMIAPTNRSADASMPSSMTVQARFVVGTDGARSFVRAAMGVGMRDYDMHQRWLNFDAWTLKPLPERLKTLKIFIDPERPHMHMPIGTRGLRMEFRVMEGETDEAVCASDLAEQFMQRKYGIGTQDVKLMRRVVYHYRTRVAERWRDRRIFLAGDAAHLMPPYMGQGACAAMRDAFNLGWKLVQVLCGRSSDVLLNEYQREREPHVEIFVMESDRLSRMVNMTDPVAVEARNRAMRERGQLHSPSLPGLKDGVLHHEPDGSVAAPSGLFAPQGHVRCADVQGRGDDVLGTGFQLWCRRDPLEVLGADERAFLDGLDCRIVVFNQPESAHAAQDLDGVYLGFLDAHEADVLIMRPDFYVFGAVKADALNALVRELAERLHATTTFVA